jgi:hypothetical protein
MASLTKSRVIFSKIERAKKHVEELHVALGVFAATNPYPIRSEDDLNTRKRTYYLLSVRDIPLEVVAVVGDVLHNLRSALDHLAYQLVVTAGNKPDRRTAFPIADSAKKYVSSTFRRKVKGMRQDAIDRIDTIKPYKGGNDVLWRLDELNNIDKHRLLITACSVNTARSMTPSERGELISIFEGSHPGESLPHSRNILKGVVPVPLKAGDKLWTVSESELEKNVQFHFDIAFNEPQVIECKPIIETLHKMADLVGRIVLEFDDLLT